MKATVLGIVLTLAAACFAAQNPAPATPPPPPAHHMHHDMMAMHMKEMHEQVGKMRATLEEMKANLGKITDPALRQQAQYDVDLWETMVHHMEEMTDMMGAHSGMGMGHGMGQGMGQGMGMGGMHPEAPVAPQQPATPQN